MTFDVDGFLLGPKNPSLTGGGFTVISEDKSIHVSHTIHRQPFTNNEAELLAVAYAAFRAARGDTIRADSKCAIQWCLSGRCKARPDLNSVAHQAYRWIQEKQLTLTWIPRDENTAGVYNEFERT